MRQDYRWSELQIISNQIPTIPKRKKAQFKVRQATATQISPQLNKSAQMQMQRRSREYLNQKKKLALSASDLSIDHIKNKIRELLHTNRDSSSANLETEHFRELRSTRDCFRSNIFKNYNKKKIQLRMFDDFPSDKRDPISQQFRVSQACINRRISIKEHNHNLIFSRNERLRHICRHKQQDISIIFKPAMARKQSVGHREKTPLSKDILRFADVQLTVEPWKETQFEQFQDFSPPQN